MRMIIKMILLVIMLVTSNISLASKNNFQFQINDYQTKRQYGQTIDVYVRYAMKDGLEYSKYPDYRDLRARVLPYLEPSKQLPEETYWEIIAAKIGNDLLENYNFLTGVSIQLIVHPNENGAVFEPGFHGPIFTSGDVIPFQESVVANLPNTK